MTIKHTITLCKAVGLTARWDADYRVFVVNYRQSDLRRSPFSDYQTNDAADAVYTAVAMAKFGRRREI